MPDYRKNKDMTILFIHDDPPSMMARMEIFQNNGYDILQVSTVQQALDLYPVHPVRMVVFALETQGMDGYDLCRRIRSDKKDHYVYFIMAAKMEDKSKIFNGLKEGVDAYISLPINPDELEAAVQVGLRISGVTIREPRKRDILSREDIGEYDILLARMALENQLITKETLAKAFSIQKRDKQSGRGTSLGSIFLEKEMIPPDRINDLHTAVKKHREKKSGILAIKNQAALIFDEIDHANDDSDEPMFRIQISEDRLEAFISIKKKMETEITSDDILGFLSRKNIVFGVSDVEKIIAMLQKGSNGEKTFLIARGQPPVPGSDASMKYFFDTGPLRAGTINPDGSIDYRERGSVLQVQSSDLLAVKTPMQEGVPGRDIHNMSILVPETTDIELKCGEGVRLSEDGLSVYAAIEGQPNLSVGGCISVFTELVIDGDVDFNTGNIDFDGNLIVKGAVLDGFTVKCGHLNATEILAATLITMGDVVVSGGIYGADIKTEGDVKAKFITDSNVKAYGNVTVEKEVIQSKIRSSGSFVARQAKVISSFISAKMGVEVKEIGTDVSSPCRINVGMDENVKKRIQGLNYVIDKKRKNLEIVQKQYEKQSKKQETIHLRIAEFAQIQERLTSALGKINIQIAELKTRGLTKEEERMGKSGLEIQKRLKLAENEIERFFEEQERIDERITEDLAVIEEMIKEIETISDEKTAILKWSEEEKGLPVIKVTGSIHQGTKLFGIHSSIVLQDTIRNVTIKEVMQPDIDFWQMIIQ